MRTSEYSEAIYGTTDLIQRICVGPVSGLGHGYVYVPEGKNSCRYCGGCVVTIANYDEVGPHRPTPPQKHARKRR